MKRSTPLKRIGFKPKAPPPRAKKRRARRSLPAAPTHPVRSTMGQTSSVVRAVPKQPADENPRVLLLARDKPCLLRWQRECLGVDGSTTVACHENRLSAQKGMGYKAHDWRSVWGCRVCHWEFDHPQSATYDVLDAVFAAAWARQLVEWAKIAQNPAQRPSARAAAAWALERATAYLKKLETR